MRCVLMLMVMAIAFTTGCQTDQAGGGSVRGGGRTGKALICAVPEYGLNVTMPSTLVGRAYQNHEGHNGYVDGEGPWFVAFDANLLGDVPTDEPAMIAAALMPFGMGYPSPDVRRLPSTASEDGHQWLHFEGHRAVQGYEFTQYISVTRRGPVLYTVTTLSFGEIDAALEAALASVWQGVQLSEPTHLTTETDIDRTRIENTAGPIWQSYYSRDRYAEALAAIDLLLSVDPADSDYTTMAAETLLAGHMYEEGLARMPDWTARFPNNAQIAWRNAFMLAEKDRDEEALAEYRRAVFDLGSREGNTLTAYFSYLMTTDQLAANAAEMEQLADEAGIPGLYTYVARAWQLAENQEQFDAVMERLKLEARMVPELNESMVNLYLNEENYADALDYARVVSAADDPQGNLLAGMVLYSEGRYAEARREVQACLASQPTNAEAQGLLEAVNAQLGKADSSLFQEEIEPVTLPAGLLESIGTVTDDFSGDHGAYYDYYGTFYSFEPGTRQRSTTYQRFTVTRQSALRRMSEATFRFDPLYERVYVNYLRVYSPEGELIAEGDLANFYTSADSDEVLMSQRKELHIPVPSLDVGCTVELCVTYQTLGQQDTMPYKKEVLASTLPGQLFFTGVTGEVDAVAIVTANGLEEREFDAGRLFVAKEPTPITMEASTPPSREYLPMVWLSSAANTWETEAADYFERAGDFFEPSEAAGEKAGELVGEDPESDAAIARLTQFVRDSLTYQGLVFGVRSQLPNLCSDILSNRYGDCKDHSFLLMHLLRSAGVRAYPALVDTERSARADLPDTGQFNHMILYLPDFDGGHFIDATDKFATLHSVPIGLGGEPALVLDPEAPRIVTIPDYRLEDNCVAVNRSMVLEAGDVLRIEERAELQGYIAGWLRSTLQDVTEREYPLTLSDALDLPELNTIESVSVDNLDDRELPLIVTYTYTLSSQFHNVGTLVTGRMPGTWEQLLLNLPPGEKERSAPIWHRMPLTIDTCTALTVPTGYSVSQQVSLEPLTAQTPYLDFSFSPALGDGAVSFATHLASPAGLFPATDAPARRTAYARANATVQHPIALEPAQ